MCYSINAWLTLQENLLGNFNYKCVSCIPSRNSVRLLASEALPVVPRNCLADQPQISGREDLYIFVSLGL